MPEIKLDQSLLKRAGAYCSCGKLVDPAGLEKIEFDLLEEKVRYICRCSCGDLKVVTISA